MCVCVAKPVTVKLRCHATALIQFSSWFPTRCDTNSRWLEEVQGLYYLCSKIKALISCVVTVQLICSFVLVYAKEGFCMNGLISESEQFTGETPN